MHRPNDWLCAIALHRRSVLDSAVMLIRLTKGLRIRAGIVLATLYALCVIGPSLALAFTDGAAAAHCLTDDHHGVTRLHSHATAPAHVHSHMHADGTAHQYADHGIPAKDAPSTHGGSGTCCGLFCFAAVTGDFPVVVDGAVLDARVMAWLDDGLAGREPERINRPPIV